MSLVLTTSARDSINDVIVDLLDTGSSVGKLQFYNSDFSTLLSELSFSDPAFTASSNGIVSADTITSDTSANNNGTIERFRFVNSDDVPVVSGTVSAGSGGDINLNSLNISVGDSLSITSLTLSMPEGSF